MRVGIFGGSFNPIHNGHIKIAQAAIREVKLDRCLLVVANNPPHKQLAGSVPAVTRFNMTCTALKSVASEPIYACNVEIVNNLSYTCDMLECLSAAKGFEEAEFYLIMGADMLTSFLTWRNPEQVCRLIKGIIAVGRVNSVDEADFVKSYEIITRSLGIEVILLDDVSDISSTKVREHVATFQPIDHLVPYETERFIYENALYASNSIGFIVNDLRKSLNMKRFTHSISTMRESILLAKHYGADETVCGLAGLVHDCSKLSGVDYLILCARYDIPVNEYELEVPALLHAKLGAHKARNVYGINDRRIINAILNHTLGGTNLDIVSKIVYVADKVEVLRDFPEAAELRKIAYRDLDEALLAVLCFNIDKLHMAGKPVHPATIEAIAYYQSMLRHR